VEIRLLQFSDLPCYTVRVYVLIFFSYKDALVNYHEAKDLMVFSPHLYKKDWYEHIEEETL
jgi:hypothetical protein